MPISSWEDGDGCFIPETWDGQVLADEIDDIFAAQNPAERIANRFGNPPVESEIHRPRRDRIKTNLYLGALSVGLVIAEYYLISQFCDSLKAFH